MDKTSLAAYLLNKYGQRLMTVKCKEISVTTAMVRNDFNPWLMFYTNKEDDPHAMAGTDGELDIKCGALSAMLLKIPVFFQPSLTTDPGWVGVLISDKNGRIIKDLVDSAWSEQGRGPRTIQYIDLTDRNDEENEYQPEFITGRPTNAQKKPEAPLPIQLRKMKESYNYQIPLAQRQEVNFYRQGQMVSDYEDDYDDFTELYRTQPDYHGLTNNQLRTYFALRTKWRKKDFPPYRKGMGGYLILYASELVNCIGCGSPTEAFDQLRRVLNHYQTHLGPGVNINRLAQEMVLYYGLDHQRAARVFKDELAEDLWMHTFLYPEKHSPKELLAAFGEISPDYQKARLYKEKPTEYTELFTLIWQQIIAEKERSGYDFVGLSLAVSTKMTSGDCFAGLIFDDRLHSDRVYQLDSLRSYRIIQRQYNSSELYNFYPIKAEIKKLFREVDRATRIAFHLGRPLKERPVDPQIKDAIQRGLTAFHHQQEAAKVKRVPIHLDNLDQIRDDAAVTQDQLLTEEEVDDGPILVDPENVSRETFSLDNPADNDQQSGDDQPTVASKPSEQAPSNQEVSADQPTGDLPDLTADEWFFLSALINHQPYEAHLKKHFLMASLVADSINDKLMDEIGDTVIEFDENDQPQIIKDYLTDIQDLLKKKEE